jgi:TonB family protein
MEVSVQNARISEPAASAATGGHTPAPAANRAKLSVFLVTRDDSLWPQVGADLDPRLILKQVDSVEELISSTPEGQSAIVLWDARDAGDTAAALSRLQVHSPRFAVVALDDPGNAAAWTNPIGLRQVVTVAAVPIVAGKLKSALDAALEEANARAALLGSADNVASGAASAAATSGAVSAPGPARRMPWVPAAVILGVLTVCVVTFVSLRHGEVPTKPAPAAQSPAVGSSAVPAAPAVGQAPAASSDDKVDLLIEKAQQAMAERHFIDPAENSALTLYRNALLLEPDNGEARQGLQRLAEILFARVQSALDERKIDVALQALESARSISPGDQRLAALDEKIATLRAEFGPSQILAAINAQNFDRAAQLIDEAARSKSLSPAKLAQLREELRRRHQESDVANFVKLIDTRLSQDRVLEPRNDSAVFYLNQAKAAGASAAALQPQFQEVAKRLSASVRADIDQKHLADADRLIAELHNEGIAPATIAALQHDLNAAHNAQATASAQPQYLDLAQNRLAQGKLTEPDNDSALYYVNQLRTADPKNVALPQLSSAVQAQILEQARVAVDANQTAKADALLQAAGGLGASAYLNALNDRLAQLKLAVATVAGAQEVTEASLTRIRDITLDYPAEAERKNIEGWVEMSYVVGTDGKVGKIEVLKSSPAGIFEKAAEKAIARARYKPVLRGGKPIAVTTKIRIVFHLAKP